MEWSARCALSLPLKPPPLLPPPLPDSNPRISRCAAPTMAACAAFFKEIRMQFAEPTKLDGKSGT